MGQALRGGRKAAVGSQCTKTDLPFGPIILDILKQGFCFGYVLGGYCEWYASEKAGKKEPAQGSQAGNPQSASLPRTRWIAEYTRSSRKGLTM